MRTALTLLDYRAGKMLSALKFSALTSQKLFQTNSKVLYSCIEKLKLSLFSNQNVVRDYSSTKKPDEFDTPSPYKNPGPRDYGYETKIHTGGLLPRGGRSVRGKYKPGNNWSSEKALFGQNDYIDILGDENIRPVDLIKGPKWVVGFNGNELQRISRRFRVEGRKLRKEQPSLHKSLNKRLWYLYKKYNAHRVSKYK